MKKLFAVLLTVLTLFLTACNTVAPPEMPSNTGSTKKLYLPGEEPVAVTKTSGTAETVTDSAVSTYETEAETTIPQVTEPAEVFEKYKPQNGEKVYNVKDFGAVGDGKTDDEAAIRRAISMAVSNLPATVYFPQGEYGLLEGGIYVHLPQGSGGLTIAGEGSDKSVIKYLEEWTTPGSWVALRIMPAQTPTKISEYIHDITITDIGIRDTDPVNHAWTIEKNGAKEETHGLDIQHCIRATVRNCFIDNVGDEAIDMVFCIDSEIVNNVVVNSPGAGSSGGAISVGDGCNGVTVRKNTVNGTINAADKSNFGIAIEALVNPVKNVEVYCNNVTNVIGYGINIGAPQGDLSNISVYSNEITDSTNGIRIMGIGEKNSISVLENTITNVNNAILLDGGNSKDVLFKNNIIDTVSDRAIHVVASSSVGTLFEGVTIRNCGQTAVYNAGTDTEFRNVTFENIGIGENVTRPAINQYSSAGSMKLVGVTLSCKNSKAVQGVQTIIDTVIEQPEEEGYISIQGAMTIKNCKVNRAVYNLSSGGTIDGLELITSKHLGMHAITLIDTTDCTVKNCTIEIPSRDAIYEKGSSDRNMFINNTVNANYTVVGKSTFAEK